MIERLVCMAFVKGTVVVVIIRWLVVTAAARVEAAAIMIQFGLQGKNDIICKKKSFPKCAFTFSVRRWLVFVLVDVAFDFSLQKVPRTDYLQDAIIQTI
jgi:hypothetical protein